MAHGRGLRSKSCSKPSEIWKRSWKRFVFHSFEINLLAPFDLLTKNWDSSSPFESSALWSNATILWRLKSKRGHSKSRWGHVMLSLLQNLQVGVFRGLYGVKKSHPHKICMYVGMWYLGTWILKCGKRIAALLVVIALKIRTACDLLSDESRSFSLQFW